MIIPPFRLGRFSAGPTFIHMVIGNVVEPMVFGQSMELHPVTVLLALALWCVVF